MYFNTRFGIMSGDKVTPFVNRVWLFEEEWLLKRLHRRWSVVNAHASAKWFGTHGKNFVIVSIKGFYKRSRSFSLSHFRFYNQDLGPRIKDLLSSSCTNLLTPKPTTLQCSASSPPLFLLCLIFIALPALKLQHQPFVLPTLSINSCLPPSSSILYHCIHFDFKRHNPN